MTEPRSPACLRQPADPPAELVEPPPFDAAMEPWSDGRPWDSELVLREILHYGEQAVVSAYEIGRRLVWTKLTLDNRHFEAWCSKNLPFSQRTVQNYMRVAEWLRTRPSLLEPLARAGLKKALLLTSLPEDDAQALAEEGLIPSADLDLAEVEHLPYLELQKRLQREKRQAVKRDSELAREKARADGAEAELQALQARIGAAQTADEKEARKLLEQWRNEFDLVAAKVGLGLDVLSRRSGEFSQSTQFLVRGFAAYLRGYGELEDCRCRALLGEFVTGAEWPSREGDDRPGGRSTYRLPEGRFLPFADDPPGDDKG